MELSQLRSVAAVAETGNFSRAATKCSISQPSLSQQVLNLEKELGHKLFHRLGRRVVPTEAGSVFLDHAKKILFEVENTTKELGDSPSLERRIVVGVIPTVAPYLLPDLLRRCRQKHPNLQLSFRENFKPDLVRGVVEGDLDLAIVSLPVADRQVHSESLMHETLMLVVGSDHPLASKARVRGEDLAGETFVMLGGASSLASQIQAFCGTHHFEPRIGARCAQVATVKGLVAAGAGISILPAAARGPADGPELAYVELADSAPVREVGVIRHLQRYQSRGAEQFLTLLRSMKKEPASGRLD